MGMKGRQAGRERDALRQERLVLEARREAARAERARPWWDHLEEQYQTYRSGLEGTDPTADGFIYHLQVQGFFDHITDSDGVISEYEPGGPQ